MKREEGKLRWHMSLLRGRSGNPGKQAGKRTLLCGPWSGTAEPGPPCIWEPGSALFCRISQCSQCLAHGLAQPGGSRNFCGMNVCLPDSQFSLGSSLRKSPFTNDSLCKQKSFNLRKNSLQASVSNPAPECIQSELQHATCVRKPAAA